MGCDIHGYLELVHSETYVTGVCNIPSDRDYDLFGLLAGVRNYVDAAPISEPRGLPSEVSWKMKDEVEGYGTDGHSHSWLSYKDFKDYDWDQTSLDGRVSTIDKGTGEEKGKASYTYLQDDPEKCEEMGVELKHLNRVAKDLVPYIWQGFFKFMEHLANKYGDEKVRVVFFFDN